MIRLLLILAFCMSPGMPAPVSDNTITIKGREVLWDDYLTEECTASKVLHSPVFKSSVMTLDKPWEGDGCDYFNVLYDELTSTWFMYYNALEMFKPDGSFTKTSEIHACVLTSKDGVNWTRPDVGIVKYGRSRKNNIVAGVENIPGLTGLDNFFVMLDTNPAVDPSERFKAVLRYETRVDGKKKISLLSMVSGDGLHFKPYSTITDEGYFDTLNTVMWHEASKQYICFIRSFHQPGTFKEYEGSAKDGSLNNFVRDIRVLFSDDFVTWSKPRRIEFDSPNDYPLYTNCVSVYPYAPQMLVGFPTRYVERKEWTPSFEELCGKEKRLARMKYEPRFGLAVTDCLFMCSRDGLNWHRRDEAFMRPGPEHPTNWVYGSCYPGVGMIESPSEIPGGDPILSMFSFRGHWMGEPTVLERYTIRRDGFVSLHADSEQKHLLTKPFKFSGSRMTLNFSTSAIGHVFITLVGEDGSKLRSCELFGDSTDRAVSFDGELSTLEGKTVRMLIELADADVWSFEFTE